MRPAEITTAPALSTEEALRRIVQGTAAATGEAFFQSLVQHLAGALGLRYAMAGELICGQRGRVRTLALWAGDGFIENVEYDLAGTPCEKMVGRSMCHHPADVWRRFPRDPFLAEHGIESYLGVPLTGSRGQDLGVLVVMHDQPTPTKLPLAKDLLSIFAARAAAELERQRVQRALLRERGLLEDRVAERTADLQRANAALEQEVQTRGQVEEALRQSQQRYEGILNAQQTLIIRVDPRDNRITYQNDAYARAFGLKVGDTFFLIVHPDDHERTRAVMEQVMRPPYTCSIEQRCLVQGQWRWIHWQDSVVHDRDGTIVEVQGVGFDIHDRMVAQDALAASEERFRTMFDQAPVSVQVMAPDGQTVRVNAAWEKLWGLSAEEARSYNILTDRRPVTQSVMAQILAAFAGTPQDLPPLRTDLTKGALAGAERWTQVKIFPVKDVHGAVREVVMVQEDVTERRRAELALRDSERRHKEAAAFNQRLLRELDHRVRNNLAGLLGLLNLTGQSAASLDAFVTAFEGRLRAMAHIHELLADSNWQALCLRDLIHSLLGAVGRMARHTISVDLSGPPIRIRPHHTLPLSMILLEWFTNSTKHGAHSRPSGRLTITWDLEPADDGRRLRLRWRETGGPPIPDTVVPSLGTELVKGFARNELRGHVGMSYPSDGADHHLEFRP